MIFKASTGKLITVELCKSVCNCGTVQTTTLISSDILSLTSSSDDIYWKGIVHIWKNQSA